MAQVIAELMVKIGVDADQATKAADKLEGSLDDAGEAGEKAGGRMGKLKKGAQAAGEAMKSAAQTIAKFAAAAGAAATAVFAFVNRTTQAADAVAKTSRSLGVQSDIYQRLTFGAERAGVPVEALNGGIKTLNTRLLDAGRGGAKDFAATLSDLGLSVSQLEQLNAEERLGAIGDALQTKIADPAKRTATASKLLGEEFGVRLTTLLESGSAGIRELGDEAEDLGAVLSEDTLAASEAFQDSVTNLKTLIGGLVAEVGAELIPIVQAAVDGIKEWFRANREIIRQRLREFIESITRVLVKFAPLLQDVVTAMMDWSPVIGRILELIGSLIDALGGAERTLQIAAGAFVGFKLATMAALGPVGQIAGAFAALLPVAIELGERMGEVAFSISEVGAEARRLEREAGGRTKLRGTEAILNRQETEVAQTSAVRNNLRDLSTKDLQALEGRISNQFGKKAVRQEIQLRAIQEGAGALAKQGAANVGSRAARQLGLSTLVETGQAVAAGAKARAARPKRRGGGGRSKPAAEVAAEEQAPPATLQEFLAAAQRGDLEALSKKSPIKADTQPTIAVSITNNNVQNDFKIDGSRDPKVVAEVVAAEVSRTIRQGRRETAQNIAGGTAR